MQIRVELIQLLTRIQITGIGRFIRKYKIDELSQLLMFFRKYELVGPRPNVKGIQICIHH